MKLGILFSGGKDSCYAMHVAMKYHNAMCLITMKSENPESYMFHTPNIDLASLQAESIGLPLVSVSTKGIKERELTDLKKAVLKAKELYSIEGIVTGAIESVYQATRVQKICDELGLWCFNPLWQKNQVELLNELISEGFEVIVSGVFGYPLNESWLGRRIDSLAIRELKELQVKFKINPSGEGGEFESLVLHAPFFKKRIVIKNAEKHYENNSGIFKIKEAALK